MPLQRSVGKVTRKTTMRVVVTSANGVMFASLMPPGEMLYREAMVLSLLRAWLDLARNACGGGLLFNGRPE